MVFPLLTAPHQMLMRAVEWAMERSWSSLSRGAMASLKVGQQGAEQGGDLAGIRAGVVLIDRQVLVQGDGGRGHKVTQLARRGPVEDPLPVGVVLAAEAEYPVWAVHLVEEFVGLFEEAAGDDRADGGVVGLGGLGGAFRLRPVEG